MNKPQLIKDKGFTRIYRLGNGELISLILDDENYSYIEFYNIEEKKIGSFEFSELHDYSSNYKLMRMYLDERDEKYKRKGLGEVALLFFKELTTSDIYTSPNDGQVLVDGSHLTGDALYFVDNMKRKGIISGDYPNSIEGDFENGFLDL